MTATKIDPLELLTFRLNDVQYAVDVMCVREIRGWTKATPLPFSPTYMKGVINLRGTVLPVVDLAERLSLPVKERCERCVIVVINFEDNMTGLIVDAVTDIVSVQKKELQAPAVGNTGVNQNMIKSLALLDDRMIRILDLAQLTSAIQNVAA